MENMENRIVDIVATLQKHEESIENLERWQEKQNGKLEQIEQKMDNIKNLLIGTLFSALTSLIFLALNLILKK